MNNNITYIDLDHTWTTSAGTLNINLYYKDNLHLIEKGNEKLANTITTAFNVRGLKQQQNLPEISQQQQQEHPQHQQKRHQNQQGNGQQHREEFQKHQKERQKQTPKYQQHQKERQQPQEEIKKHQEGQQESKQHKNEQLKQYQLQQQQQKHQHQQQQQLDEMHSTYGKIMPTTTKKKKSKIIPAKHYDDVKCNNTKYVHKFLDKTLVNFIYSFFFIGYFCFVSFTFNFAFIALESSGKLAIKCSAIFLIALSEFKVKLVFIIIGIFFLYRMNQRHQ